MRRNAYTSFTAGLSAYRNTYAATFATEIEKNIALAELRGYPSAIDVLLQPHKVTRDVYDHVHDIIRPAPPTPV
ncbi:MAG: hypothetical protein K6T78_03140 [Alicyclobacillus sp.]|nr:hypothetical protein [Alicyclobacillus sp.]